MADALMRESGRDLRGEVRLRESLKGQVGYRDTVYPCMLEDFSEKGMLLLSNAAVAVGERVAVELQICEGQSLPCVVDVRHVNRDSFGGKIIEIAPRNLSLLVQMIAEH